VSTLTVLYVVVQFGVLHDGKDPYPLARDLCRKLAAQKKRLVVLSNSSRLSTSTFDRLESMGYDRSWFAGCVTSGDVARAVLTTREGDDTAILRSDGRMWSDVQLGSDEPLRCLHLTWSQRGAKDGFKTKQTIDLGETPRVEVANDPESADAVLIHGTEAVTRTDESGVAEVHPAGEGEVEDLLRRAAARNLPMLVANPDLVTVSGEELVAMPGSLARKYVEDFGAPRERVHLLGKPSPIIYTLACEKFGIPKGERMVAVGDSLEHDIKGARQFGIDSVFISAGIHGRQVSRPACPRSIWSSRSSSLRN